MLDSFQEGKKQKKNRNELSDQIKYLSLINETK